MVSLDLTSFLAVPIACAAAIPAVGIGLAWLRTRARGAAWNALDVVLLLPAFLPARPIARVLENLFGERPFQTDEFWPILAAVIVSLPYAYLPARIAFAHTAQGTRLSIRPAVALSILLATTRMLGEFATEILADLPAIIVIAIPTLVAAVLIARSIPRRVS